MVQDVDGKISLQRRRTSLRQFHESAAVDGSKRSGLETTSRPRSQRDDRQCSADADRGFSKLCFLVDSAFDSYGALTHLSSQLRSARGSGCFVAAGAPRRRACISWDLAALGLVARLTYACGCTAWRASGRSARVAIRHMISESAARTEHFDNEDDGPLRRRRRRVQHVARWGGRSLQRLAAASEPRD
jgi:hypothetical protein